MDRTSVTLPSQGHLGILEFCIARKEIGWGAPCSPAESWDITNRAWCKFTAPPHNETTVRLGHRIRRPMKKRWRIGNRRTRYWGTQAKWWWVVESCKSKLRKMQQKVRFLSSRIEHLRLNGRIAWIGWISEGFILHSAFYYCRAIVELGKETQITRV